MKNLIGKKVRGFKFESREGCSYVTPMDVYVGEIGVVQVIDEKRVFVRFENHSWWYPTDLVEQNLVEETTEPIVTAIVDAYFNGTNLTQIKESIKQAYAAIEAGVNAQLVEVKEERGKL